MSDEREPLWSDTEIAEIIAGMASKWEAAILYSILRGKRDDYEARIAELEVALANVLATNRRNVEDAARIIKANQGGLELAHVSLGELGKRERRIVELEQKLATAQEHIAAQESIYQVALDSIEELEARLAQTWQPVEIPDSPGWWGYKDGRTEFAISFPVFDLRENMMHYQWEDWDSAFWLPVDDFRSRWPGKWYRLTMPWEATNE